MTALKLDSTYDGHVWGDLRQLTSSFVLKLPQLSRPTRFAFCVCKCGKIDRYRMSRLKDSGAIECLRCARSKSLGGTSRCNTPEYRAWRNMINRCYDLDKASHGGRGIRVCSKWLDSFDEFLADVGLKPFPEYQLDRYPDNDGNYEPGNVRWATPTENAQNRGNST